MKIKIGRILIVIISIIFINLIYFKIYYTLTPTVVVSNNIDEDEVIHNLKELSKKDNRIEKIVEEKDKYPKDLLDMLSRNIDLTNYVISFNSSKGKIYSDNIGKVKRGEFPLLFQYDRRWGYGIYGDNYIALNGCGPTSVAMVVAGLTGRNDVTPYKVATYAYQNGYYKNGTSWRFFTEGVKKYGITGKEINLDKNKMIKELENGHPIICSMGKGDFTTTGHIIVIIGLKNNQFIINDPSSKERSNKLWSYEQISNQIKNLWSFSK